MRNIWLRRSFIVAIHDACMAALSFTIALYLRFGASFIDFIPNYFAFGVVMFTIISVFFFVSFRLYRSIWHFASMEDLLAIVKAASLTILVFAFLMFTMSRLDGFPRSALIINWFLLICLLSAPRFAYRLYKDRGFRYLMKRDSKRIPIVLYGSGAAAEIFVRDTFRQEGALYRVVAIIDSRETGSSRTMHGINIYEGDHMLPFVLRKLARKQVKPQRLVLTEEVSSTLLQTLYTVADQEGMTISRLPRLHSFEHHIASQSPVNQRLRPVDIEDLLGRAQAPKDSALMLEHIAKKVILVTGAGGSIGSELCRQIAMLNPKSIILFELNEFALYQIQMQLSQLAPDLKVHGIIGDVRDAAQLKRVLAEHKADIIFHAAAIKHVPIAEENITATLTTNTYGTERVANAAIQQNVAQLVCISTDKAVCPSNVMGASKRLAERVLLSLPEADTQIAIVRFGNVLGSTGSVIPLFQKQLASGGPLTVTHPDITRYFMTIREAVNLIIHASALAAKQQGVRPLFVLDMGKPVKIVDMARQMIRLSGLRPEEDIQIRFTGLRAGEKLFEELFYPEETPEKTDVSGVMITKKPEYCAPEFRLLLAELEDCCKQGNEKTALVLLKKLLPEFQHSI